MGTWCLRRALVNALNRRGALAVKGRETRGTTALAIAVFAARVTVSILMISAIPKD
jgi:hypothetical protein